jgi:hypothetical protein
MRPGVGIEPIAQATLVKRSIVVGEFGAIWHVTQCFEIWVSKARDELPSGRHRVPETALDSCAVVRHRARDGRSGPLSLGLDAKAAGLDRRPVRFVVVVVNVYGLLQPSPTRWRRDSPAADQPRGARPSNPILASLVHRAMR